MNSIKKYLGNMCEKILSDTPLVWSPSEPATTQES